MFQGNVQAFCFPAAGSGFVCQFKERQSFIFVIIFLCFLSAVYRGDLAMFDNLHSHFFEGVIGSYSAYLKVKKGPEFGASKDLRAALNAAVALYHFREFIPDAHRKGRGQLSLICPDYPLLGDIVNATKHKIITQNSPQISSAENVFEKVLITAYKDDQGEYPDMEKQVIARLDNGTERDVAEILHNVLNMWIDELLAIGVLSDRPLIEKHSKDASLPKSRDEARPLNIVIIAGLRFKLEFGLRRYNYETGRIEPVPIKADDNVIFSVYEHPGYEIEMQRVNPETGIKETKTFKVKGEKATAFEQLKTDEERQKFLMRLAIEEELVSFNIGGEVAAVLNHFKDEDKRQDFLLQLMADNGLISLEEPVP